MGGLIRTQYVCTYIHTYIHTYTHTHTHTGVHRSDYMLHDAGDGSPVCAKQVEINTVASSFAALSQRVSGLHKMLLGTNSHKSVHHDFTAQMY